MAFSRENFVDGYVAEVREHIDSITSHIISLKNNPEEKKEHITEILRHLHTIKGASRMLDFLQMEQISHALESVFKSIQETTVELSTNIFKLSFRITEFLEIIISEIAENGDTKAIADSIIETCERAASGFFFEPDKITIQDSDDDDFEMDEWEQNFTTTSSFDKINSVRIDIDRINSIIHEYDNLIIKQFRLKHQIEALEKRLADRNADRLYEVPRQLHEELLSTESSIFETQHQIFALRMLPLEMVLVPLKKEIEKEALALSKDIITDIPTTSFMLDKVILEQLRTILLHLVRNSLDHGIEDEDTRSKLGKNKKGLIAIHASQVSNRILITVQDDGCGIQYDKIREQAIQLNSIRREEISAMPDKDLQQYLFMPGFTTSEQTTEISGRGIGLDVVRSAMEKIKGKIRISTKANEGTTFELSIPLTLATQRGLFVVSGSTKVMIPSHYIHEVITTSGENILTMQNQHFINIHNKIIPLHFLSSILGTGQEKNISNVIVVEYLETKMAIVVDSIKQNENVIITPLPECLQKMNSLQGVVYDENYSIIPIIDIPCIMQKMRELVSYDTKKYASMNMKKTRTVLIVDDSATTRQIEQAIFEADGYSVETAIDGVDAIEKLRKKNVDIVVTDISMPRMDGKTLLSNIRRMENIGNIPVIVVSGAYDIYSKKQFMDLGAQAFIVKSDFQRGNLLDTVKELLDEN
ncbi:response regulator [Treponema sp.]|uniref:hybrid sensor histidine kinase/response regulator n=1 Tax=Treponema sp. TaxID=166 RepID=UPI00388E9661